MKFLPFDEEDMRRLDKLILAEPYAPLMPGDKRGRGERTTEDLHAYKRDYMKRWRARMLREDPEKYERLKAEKREERRRSYAENKK